jgi:hypothetical protein
LGSKKNIFFFLLLAVGEIPYIDIGSGYTLQSFLPQRQAKKAFHFYPAALEQ